MDMQGAKTNSKAKEVEMKMQMETTIVNALDQKRRGIAHEITEFTAMKEKEFIAFEQQLRAAHQNTVNPEYSQQDPRTPNGNTSVEDMGRRGPDQGSFAVLETSFDSLRERFLANISNHNRQPTKLPNGNVSSANELAQEPPSFGATEIHEREVEFQGLFTPSYLPLLAGSSGTQKDWPSKPSLKISIQPQERTSSLRNSASMSAVSASFPPSAIAASDSPPITRSLSASVPGEQASHHDRPSPPSPPSDTSGACLRSSLRDPSQPRSPKRVLFSIDNLVVSPSTSPKAQQRSSAPQIRLPGINNVPRGFENVAAGKSKEPHMGGKWDHDSATAFATNRSTMATGNRKPNVHAAGSYQDSLGMAKPRMRSGEDEFMSIGLEDDMFTFDEDLDLEEFQSSEKNEGSAGSEEDDEGSQGEPTPSSPHAGSLPIEIKWPARRDRRN